MNIQLEKLERRLGYSFKDGQKAIQALTHRSYGSKNNERFEFLGDSILNLIITEQLYKKFPNAKEGELSRLRSCLVRGTTLASIAKELKIGEFLLLGVGELKSGGHRRISILADCLESLIGAIYLDGGMKVCQNKVLEWFDSRIAMSTTDDQKNKDSKTLLQEWLQKRSNTLPVYELIEVSGLTHNQKFRVKCLIKNHETVGVCSTRRGAEQNAARKLLDIVLTGGL